LEGLKTILIDVMAEAAKKVIFDPKP